MKGKTQNALCESRFLRSFRRVPFEITLKNKIHKAHSVFPFILSEAGMFLSAVSQRYVTIRHKKLVQNKTAKSGNPSLLSCIDNNYTVLYINVFLYTYQIHMGTKCLALFKSI